MTTADRHSVPIGIREAEHADLLSVYRLEQRCFPSPWPYQAFLSHLDATAFLLATVNGSLAGYVVADTYSGFAGTRGHVKDLAVGPEHRRRGVATRLLEAALSRLRASGARRVSLEVRRDNAPARALYETFEFTEERIEDGYYEDGTDAVVMARSLSDPSPGIDIG